MALDSYDNLQTAVMLQLENSGIETQVEDWITLAESTLNRRLPAVETSTTLTATVGSREIDTSSVSAIEPIRLMMTYFGNEQEIDYKPYGTIERLSSNGLPAAYAWSRNAQKVYFDRPADTAYTYRWVYREKFALSDSATTNWLLDNHPDVYFAATLVWGSAMWPTDGMLDTTQWEQMLERKIPEVARDIAAAKMRGVFLRTDPALTGIGRYDINTDEGA